MHHRQRRYVATIFIPAVIVTAALGASPVQQSSVPRDLGSSIARFAPADIGADLAALPAGERNALAKLIEAARIMDALFLRQVWSGNDALLQQLSRDAVDRAASSRAAQQLHYFLINKGPWSRLDHNAPFIEGVPAKPEGANFYPAGATKADVEKWIASLPDNEKRAATGFFTTIRRAPDGQLRAVPYSVEYQGELARAAALLREAADLTSDPDLKKYLTTREIGRASVV
jgi:hypothetical protein